METFAFVCGIMLLIACDGDRFDDLNLIMTRETTTPAPTDFSVKDRPAFDNLGYMSRSPSDLAKELSGGVPGGSSAAAFIQVFEKALDFVEQRGETAPYVTAFGAPCNPNEKRLCFEKTTTTTTTTPTSFLKKRRDAKKAAVREAKLQMLQRIDNAKKEALIPQERKIYNDSRGSWNPDLWDVSPAIQGVNL